jgi:hypothetical protein
MGYGFSIVTGDPQASLGWLISMGKSQTKMDTIHLLLSQSTGWVETNPNLSFGINWIIYLLTSYSKNLSFFAGYLADWP